MDIVVAPMPGDTACPLLFGSMTKMMATTLVAVDSQRSPAAPRRCPLPVSRSVHRRNPPEKDPLRSPARRREQTRALSSALLSSSSARPDERSHHSLGASPSLIAANEDVRLTMRFRVGAAGASTLAAAPYFRAFVVSDDREVYESIHAYIKSTQLLKIDWLPLWGRPWK